MSVKFYLFAVLFVVIIPGLLSLATAAFYYRYRYKKEVTTDITAEQMLASEKKVSDILGKYNLQPGDPIESVARALNISKGKIDPELSTMASLREIDKAGKLVVDFGPGQTEESMRFNFAHECGHVINGEKAPVDNPGGHGKSKSDQLADYVAAALLMPRDDVAAFLLQHNYKDASKGGKLRLIRQLECKYKVEEVTVMRRIKEVYMLMDWQTSTQPD